MSRRIVFYLLAASALIATQATADPQVAQLRHHTNAWGIHAVPAHGRPGRARLAHGRRAFRSVPGLVLPGGWPAYALPYGVAEYPAAAGAADAAYADVGVAPVYPYPLPDPAWQLCQIEGRPHRDYYCGPYSYHPYGLYGYRPNGTYKAYRSAPAYVSAPNAKIIRVNPAD